MNTIGKLFGFNPAVHSVKTEVVAGIVTFLTMSYILAVNPSIFSSLAGQGMDTGAVFTATALASIVGTLLMAIIAKLPFGLAPGMGLNAFFVYTICLAMGYSWQFALTAVLIEGFIFVILTITNIRSIIVDAIPMSLKKAIGAGIGLFIAFIGLQSAKIIVDSDSTLVVLGDCMHGEALLAIIGIIICSIFTVLHIRGGLLLGILLTTLIGIPMGLTHLNGIVDSPPSIAPIFCQFQWTQICSWDMVIVVLSLLFIDLFDTLGTLIGVSGRAGILDSEGHMPRINQAFFSDAFATIAGACFGTSTTTTYVESAAGVAQGGRTGLAAFTTAICFALSLVFAPLFLAIPNAATAPALVLVGLFMVAPLKDLDYYDYSESIPAFLTLVLIPMTYSISDGILCGVIFYVLINVVTRQFKKLSPTLYILAIVFILKYLFV
ncbi:MAG: NCS2 family permease [Prevotellaceae bacterium]|nr:NCS2 family permease [Candidatus Colivivens equi]MCQ2076915.1 NCS2 family permease [Bacteroidaceae bacterium]